MKKLLKFIVNSSAIWHGIYFSSARGVLSSLRNGKGFDLLEILFKTMDQIIIIENGISAACKTSSREGPYSELTD